MDQMQIHVLHLCSESLKSPSENLKLQETGAPPHLKVAGEGRIAKKLQQAEVPLETEAKADVLMVQLAAGAGRTVLCRDSAGIGGEEAPAAGSGGAAAEGRRRGSESAAYRFAGRARGSPTGGRGAPG